MAPSVGAQPSFFPSAGSQAPRPPLLCTSVTHSGLQTVVKTTANTHSAGEQPEVGSVPTFNGSPMRSGPWRGYKPVASVGKQRKRGGSGTRRGSPLPTQDAPALGGRQCPSGDAQGRLGAVSALLWVTRGSVVWGGDLSLRPKGGLADQRCSHSRGRCPGALGPRPTLQSSASVVQAQGQQDVRL